MRFGLVCQRLFGTWSQVDHALDSLVKSMRWDERTFGLEYDLELFNIVAVDDFNMGAMENKSLNIFNSRWGGCPNPLVSQQRAECVRAMRQRSLP
jgi:aminopeptidase N